MLINYRLWKSALQGLVLTEHQTAHISADMIKALISTEHFAVLLHSNSNGRRHSYQRKHRGIFLFFPRLFMGLGSLSCSLIG